MRNKTLITTALAALIGLPALVIAGPEASNFKKETKLGANYWNVKSVVDSDLDTCWMLPGESSNKGEWVMFDVPKGTVDKIGIFPGWGQDEDTFADYARVKQIKVEVMCCTGDEKMQSLHTSSLPVADKAEMQVLDIPDTALGSDVGFGGKVRITVEDFYQGRDFPNLAVSEMVVIMGEYDAATVEISEVSGEADGHTRDLMRDDDPKTFWAGPKGSITFEAPGYGVSSVGIQAGPATHARPKKVKVTANDRSVETELENSDKLQLAPVPSIMGYTGSAWGDVTVEILEVYDGSSSPEVAIAELKPQATNYEGL